MSVQLYMSVFVQIIGNLLGNKTVQLKVDSLAKINCYIVLRCTKSLAGINPAFYSLA